MRLTLVLLAAALLIPVVARAQCMGGRGLGIGSVFARRPVATGGYVYHRDRGILRRAYVVVPMRPATRRRLTRGR